MTPEQREGGIVPARLATAQGQLQRARGETRAAIASARQAAALARRALDGSALERGALLGGAATALLQLDELDDALRLAEEAERLWREAGVSQNVSTRTVASVRTSALFLRGDLRAALAAMRAADDDAHESASVPARAARDATQAKALAWLSHSDQALALAASAQAAMCGALGEASMDCLRLRLSAIDTRLVAGDLDGAARELGAVAAALAAQPSPPLQASADTFSALHALLSTPDAARLARLEELLSGSAARGGLAARNALRMLLLAAQELDRSGHSDLALEAAHTALLLRAAPAAPVGMDAALLSIWQARIDARPAPEAARHALALALGETHPWVVSGPARP